MGFLPMVEKAASVSSETEFLVRFWGVRGSIACPGPGTVRYGGNTSCIEVRCGPHLLIFDAGTGIRALGAQLAGEAPVDVDLFLTHTHLDHISGLPFFAPAFDARNRIRLWAGHLPRHQTLESVLCNLMMAPLFPLPLSVFKVACEFHDFPCGATLQPKPGVTLRTAPLNHPNGACGYRIEYGGRSVALITDTEHRPRMRDPQVLELAAGADVMIYDATYTDAEYEQRKGWGHSTWQECCRVAEAAGVGQAVLFHHEPTHDDDAMDRIADAAAALRPGTVAAREGMVIRL